MSKQPQSKSVPVTAGPQAPKGRRIEGNLGPGSLYPGIGSQVRRDGIPRYCGAMTGQVFGVTEHPNSKDPRRMSYRFAGKFLLIDHNGTVINGHECYFPPKVERALRAALDLNPSGQPVPVAIEVWCEPDQEGKPRSPMEYSYASYDRSIQRENDPLMALAYETGLLERPTTALPAPETDAEETIDPETGEITRRASVAA